MSQELLSRVVAERRLSSEAWRSRNRFTVARDEALLRLRGSEWSPHAQTPGARAWTWTLALLRAMHIASDAASVRVELAEQGEQLDVHLHFAVPDADLGDLELSGLLYAALESDRGAGLEHVRIRRQLARACNAALGQSPIWLELHTPVGSRRWERSTRQTADEPRDPYDERLFGESSDSNALRVSLAISRPLLSRTLGSLFSRTDPLRDIDDLWHRAWLGADREEHVRQGFSLVPHYPGALVQLGRHATYCSAPLQGAVWLVRDGVLLARLDDALAGAGLETTGLHGYIDCPALQLTVDEGKVVLDDAFDELVAWLFDVRAHMGDDGRVEWPQDSQEVYEGLHTAGGVVLSFDALESREDIVFVWRHRASEVPANLRNRVLALRPSQHHWLRAHRSSLRLVPLHVLGRAPGVRPADLGELVQSSFAPVRLHIEPFVDDDLTCSFEISAFVHRQPTAERGSAVVLAYGRRVGLLTDPSQVIAGVTVVIELADAESTTIRIDVLQDDLSLLRRMVVHVMRRVVEDVERLLERVLDDVGGEAAWAIPFVRARVGEASAWSLGLHYLLHRGMPVLRWPETALVRLIVGHTLHGASRTLLDAWMRARAVGGVVTTERTRRWKTLESENEAHRPWVLSPDGRSLVERTLGREAIWAMPIVAEAQPQVAPIAEQPALRLSPSEVARLRARYGGDPGARMLLLAHALACKAARQPDFDIEDLPLLRQYDPRAMTPIRLVSLAWLRELVSKPGMVPLGAVARSLSEPVLEVAPGLAVLLAQVEDLRPARVVRQRGATTLAPVRAPAMRKGGRREDPLVTIPIVDRLAAGALTLERKASTEGIALWARGLRVGNLRLPTPLRELTGRLWLTDAGIAAGHVGIHALALRHGRALALAATRAWLLMPPGSSRREALGRFIEGCRSAGERGTDRAGVASSFGWQPASDEARTTKALPQALGRGLSLVVRHALAQPAMIETSLLSRVPVRVADTQAWPWRLRLGRRHPWIRRALHDDARAADVRLAACLIVCEAMRAADVESTALVTALLRLLDGALVPGAH